MKTLLLAAAVAAALLCPALSAGTDDHTDHDHAAQPHAAADAHGDSHDDHDETLLQLSPAQRRSLDLGAAPLQEGDLTTQISLPAEVQLDPLRVVHLTPRVTGVVTAVHHRRGDWVQQGAVLAELDSRELAEAASQFLAAASRMKLAQQEYDRVKALRDQGIVPLTDWQEAVQHHEESRIALRVARESLAAMGLSKEDVAALKPDQERSLGYYALTAPISGALLEQHITLGEKLPEDRPAFVAADTSVVWVTGRVTERDLVKLTTGLTAQVTFDAQPDVQWPARVDFVGRRIDRETRTAEVRLVLANPSDRLRDGMYARVTINSPTPSRSGMLLAPLGALVRMDQGDVVFVQQSETSFRAVPVTVTGRSPSQAQVQLDLTRLPSSQAVTEASAALAKGSVVVTGDVFVLKSLLNKDGMSDGHAH